MRLVPQFSLAIHVLYSSRQGEGQSFMSGKGRLGTPGGGGGGGSNTFHFIWNPDILAGLPPNELHLDSGPQPPPPPPPSKGPPGSILTLKLESSAIL